MVTQATQAHNCALLVFLLPFYCQIVSPSEGRLETLATLLTRHFISGPFMGLYLTKVLVFSSFTGNYTQVVRFHSQCHVFGCTLSTSRDVNICLVKSNNTGIVTFNVDKRDFLVPRSSQVLACAVQKHAIVKGMEIILGLFSARGFSLVYVRSVCDLSQDV